MVLVDLQWIKGTQFFADNGEVLDSGTINIYDATTTSLRTTYSNYLGTIANTLNGSNQIVLAADGRLDESVYIPTGLWKFVLKDSAGNTIATEDNIEGALDTDALAITEALPNTPVISKTSDYTVVSGDQSKIINANPTGGSFVLTLPSAATVGDGWRITIRHAGTANQVKIAGVSSQTIDGATARSLGAQYESLSLVSDGANWHIDGHALGFNYGVVPFIFVENRTLVTPPVSPTSGARYIIAGSGTPTGDWATYSNNDIVEANGQGGWFRYTPAEGWQAYDRNANQNVLYTGSTWEGLPATDDPAGSDLGKAIYSDVKAQNTAGGNATSGSWQTRTLNTETVNTITGVSLSSNQITLPAGEYLVFGHSEFFNTNNTRIRLKSTTTSTNVTSPNNYIAATDGSSSVVNFSGYLSLSAQEIFEFQYRVSNGANNGLGVPQNISSESEIYSIITIIDLASLQGAQGDTGAQGPEGFSGFEYTFSTTTSMADPGAGILRLNNATLSSVTAIAIDDTSAATGNPDVSAEILSWDDGSSTIKGKIKVSKVGAAQNFAIYNLTAITDNSGWSQLDVTYVSGSGSFTNADSVAIEFIEKGDKGDTGSSGVTGSTTFNFDNATADADPGSGELRLDNATPASATTAYIDNANRGGSTVTTWLDSFDDSGGSSDRGILTIADAASPTTVFHIYRVTGSIVDGTGYRKVTISSLGGAGSFTNGNELVVSFSPTGPAGAGLANIVEDVTPQLGGTLDTNAKQIRYSKGADVASPGGGALTLGTDGNYFDITGTNAITSITTLAVGTHIKLQFDGILTLTHHSTDLILPGGANITTAAGDEAEFVEYASGDWRCTNYSRAAGPVNARGQGKETIWIPASAMWARTTNGPAAASRELTTGGDIMIKGWAFDTTTEEGVQFYLGLPKSWDKGTITFQAFWTNASGLTTETVSWGLSAGAYTDSDPIDTTDLGTEVRVSDTWLAQNDLHVSAESAAVTVGNTPVDDDMIIGQIVRSVSNDNMTGDAELLGVKIHFTTSAATDA